jgi:predicted transcriptional regulator
MRASIELSDEQTAKLREIASRRGEEDFSKLVQEAIDLYLDRSIERQTRIREALSVIGSLDEASANRLEETVLQLRSTWR